VGDAAFPGESKGKFLAMNILDTPHAPPPESERIAAEDKDTFQFRRIVRALLATWRIPLLATLVLLVVAVTLLVALRAILPPTRTYISQLQFTFPSAESGRYPNNSPFSINELLDPAILEVVYDQLDLGKYDVDRNKFYGSFSIRPFTPAESEITERFRQQLADRRVSPIERERLETQLRAQLAAASRGAAELIFLPPRKPPIPVAVGRAIVHKVPVVWSQLAIEKKGVLRIPGFSAAAIVVAPDSVDRQPLPLAILGLLEASERLDDRLTELLKAPGVLSVRDSVSGKSIRDLDRDMRDLQLFHTNPLRAQLVQYRFDDGGPALQQVVERRINDIEVRAAGVAKQAEAVGDSIAQFVQATAGLRGRPAERKTSDSGAAPGAATIPQVGESFIDRIIDLTRKDRDAEQDRTFIAERTQKQFDYNQQAITLRSEQNRWKELLADLRSDATARKDLDEASRGKIVRELRYAIDDANAKWAALSRMEMEFAANRTGRTAEIYTPSAAYRDVVASDLILNTTVLGTTLWSLIIFFLAFWAIRAARLLIRS
jgi:hypothetical protein